MSTSVPPTGSTNSSGQAISGTPGSKLSGGSNSVLGPDAFLQLMMTQLTHQDPTQPSDPTQYLSELAQFTQVEQATNTAQSTAQSAAEQAVTAAVSLIGHTVSYTDQSTGQTVSGTVQKVAITSNGPTLTIGGIADIPPSSVTEVQ
jgi:flagellar basal-body rod modification protein FlgD